MWRESLAARGRVWMSDCIQLPRPGQNTIRVPYTVGLGRVGGEPACPPPL